jgi:acetate kinase
MKILVLNAGSSSLKFDLYETSPEAIASNSDHLLARGTVERVSSMADALGKVFEQIGSDGVEAAGHRIVHGGDRFHESVIIDSEVEKEIERLSSLAPLHNPHNLEAYRAAREHLPGAPHVAVFDTAFHHSLPAHAYAYALPYDYLIEKGIRRYGFHGISHRYVSWRFAQLHGKRRADYRMITCHLGNGCSVCAIDHGRSVDTSMGFTPLEGLIMGTRSGDVDAGAILHLVLREGLKADEVARILNSTSGLKGLSGISSRETSGRCWLWMRSAIAFGSISARTWRQ